MARRSIAEADLSVADRLLAAAERLYGEHGLAGVSLRQIGIAARTGNNYAVQYHFGSVAGLVEAILAKRLPAIEVERARLLALANAAGRMDTSSLMGVLFRPVIDCRDEQGGRSFARFLLALNTNPEGAQFANGGSRLMPIAQHVFGLLHVANPEVPLSLMLERQRLVAIMILTSVFNRYPPYDDRELDESLIENVLEMAAAALVAPTPHALSVSMIDLNNCVKPN